MSSGGASQASSVRSSGPGQSARRAEAPVLRIGLLQCIERFDDAALRYLILSVNTHQRAFAFEFLPFDRTDPLLLRLGSGEKIARDYVKGERSAFYERHREFLRVHGRGYGFKGEPPTQFQIITNATFDDNYYYEANGQLGIFALGHWERSMAPPSILEFVQVLAIRDAVWRVCPGLSAHLGTRGCLFDFANQLSDLRQMVLIGAICSSCQTKMRAQGYRQLAEEIGVVLSRSWLGDSTNPTSAAGITAKLGHDLFIQKGLKPSVVESIRTTLVQEGTKQLLTLVGALLLAGLIVWLGLKSP